MRRLTTTSLLLASAVLLAACSGAAAGASAPSAPSDTPAAATPTATEPPTDSAPVAGTDLDACEIVTADDVAAVAKVDEVAVGTFEATPTSLSPGRTECTYEGDFGGLIVQLTPEDGVNLYDAARGSYDDASDIAGHGGDGAFFSADNNRAFFSKGSVTVMLTIFLNDGAELRPFAEEIGRLAMSKV